MSTFHVAESVKPLLACARLSDSISSGNVLKAKLRRARLGKGGGGGGKNGENVSPQPPRVFRISYYWTTFHHYLGAWNRLSLYTAVIQLAVFTSEGNRLRFYHRVIGNNRIDPTHQSSIIIRKSIDKNLLIKNSATLFVVDNLNWDNEKRTLGTNLSFTLIFTSCLYLFCFHLLL